MLYVTRHRETTQNAQGLVYGRADVPLTEKGQMQAQELVKKIVDLPVPITKIIHSPLQRARDTTQVVADRLSLPLTVGERLVEMDFGDYNGLPSKSEDFQRARLALTVRFPNGESVLDVYARIVPLLKGCVEDEENVYLLVCHNALIRVVNAYFHPMPNEEFFTFMVDNTELVSYE